MSGDRIARIRCRPLAVPFASAFATGAGAYAVREIVLVELALADGRVAYTEASPLATYSGATVAAAVGKLAALGSALCGLSTGDAWVWLEGLPSPADASEGAARCGLEAAVAGLGARAAGLALHQWLAARFGFEQADDPVVLRCNATVEAAGLTETVEAVERAAAAGFDAIKVKVGAAEPEQDAERMLLARQAAGAGVALRADANGAWDVGRARRFLRAVEPVGLAFVEEPVRSAGPAALACLAASSSVPLAVDESCRSLAALEEVIERGAAQVLVIKPMVSGLIESVRMMRRALDAGMEVVVTTTFDAAWGTALAADVAVLLPEPRPACGLATLDLLVSPVGCAAPTVMQGRMRLEAGADQGIAPGEETVARFAAGPWREMGE